VTDWSNPSGPAGWLADPTGRHQHRYWDGTNWTDDVADRGATSVDPFSPAPPAQSAPPPTAAAPPPAQAAPPSTAAAPAPLRQAPVSAPRTTPRAPTAPAVCTTSSAATHPQRSTQRGIVALGVAFVVIVLALLVALALLFSR
jgi:hypothetical protein